MAENVKKILFVKFPKKEFSFLGILPGSQKVEQGFDRLNGSFLFRKLTGGMKISFFGIFPRSKKVTQKNLTGGMEVSFFGSQQTE